MLKENKGAVKRLFIAVANQVVLDNHNFFFSKKTVFLCFREKIQKVAAATFRARARGGDAFPPKKHFFHENMKTLFSIDFLGGD